MSGVDRLVCHEGEAATIIASLAGARLLDVTVRPRGLPDFEGAIILGRVERFSPELDAAFIDIGQARSGFLRRVDMVGFESGRPPPAGMPLMVQVARDPTEDKGARVTMNLGLVGRYVVFKPLLANAEAMPIIGKDLGAKALRMTYAEGGSKRTRIEETTADQTMVAMMP